MGGFEGAALLQPARISFGTGKVELDPGLLVVEELVNLEEGPGMCFLIDSDDALDEIVDGLEGFPIPLTFN